MDAADGEVEIAEVEEGCPPSFKKGLPFLCRGHKSWL